MLQFTLTIIFLIGYYLISIEAKTHINKGAIALIMSGLMWSVLMFLGNSGLVPDGSHELLWHEYVLEELLEHTGEVAGILFFLIGAMSIVEVVDHYHGFELVTKLIKTRQLTPFIWISSWVTFFLSAMLDNLTTTIVMVSLLKNLVESKHQRWLLASMMVIAANAGGAWSPIGDVTTTMLWIGGQITPLNIIIKLILPSALCMIIPLLIVGLRKNRRLKTRRATSGIKTAGVSERESKIIFLTGCLGLIFVPVFKSITHLPPYVGITFVMAILWVVVEFLNKKRPIENHHYSFANGIKKIDLQSVFFFLGILLAIGALQVSGALGISADFLEKVLANKYLVAGLSGILSAVVDNVPLVAAFQHMYDYPPDDAFWEGLAFCAGTGGSMLIIGSAAGVAAMGMERITFGWYLRHIAGLALAGYLIGLISYYLLNQIII